MCVFHILSFEYMIRCDDLTKLADGEGMGGEARMKKLQLWDIEIEFWYMICY